MPLPSMNRGEFKGRCLYGTHEDFPGSSLTADEVEFAMAVDRYKRAKQRPYPTWAEVLGVLKSLGWRKVAPPAKPPV